MTGRRIYPRKGKWWDPEDGGPWTAVTVWFGLTSWLVGVDLETDVRAWTFMVRCGPFGLSVFRAQAKTSIAARVRDWWSLPIDWYGVGVTRGGFFSQWWLGGSVRPEYHAPGAALWSVGGRRVDGPSIVDQAVSWRSAWDPWRPWSPPFPSMSEIVSRAQFTVARGGIRYIDAPRSIP